ncbi:electrogenic sodium bicarbonate cotransporter 1-like isoform X3 [Mercenaria mercenaria]|uniref:electrogenic sodium bicarbonate cotransporter 1-like isoform X3 n=1 Tax=Mercenaria mercenaria TaxID=6596 RepID=UPI00234FB03A|nr:electrogenic sodium bicarbonate cotransporter 1-like isoform X3 [Mercenaria mercenaria]
MDLPVPNKTSTDGQTFGLPLRDLGSFVHSSTVSDAEIKDHRSADTVLVGLHLPRQGARHRRQKRGHKRKSSQPHLESTMSEGGRGSPRFGGISRRETYHATPPSQHVQFLLGEEEDDEEHRTHDLFCELGELFTHDGEMEWKETARWIKFEEDVEEGGERWSKPHVATLSLHSLFELRSCLHNGTVILDMEVQYFYQIIDILLDNMCASNQLEETLKDQVRDVLLQRHRHLNEKHEKRHHDNGSSKIHLPLIRSLADIGRKYSLPKEMHNHNEHEEYGNTLGTGLHVSFAGHVQTVRRHAYHVYGLDKQFTHSPATLRRLSIINENGDDPKNKLKGVKTLPNFNQIMRQDSHPKINNMSSLGSNLRRNQSSGEDLYQSASTAKLNSHFMKKIPPGSEAANVLCGEVDFLNHMVSAFIRLKTSSVMGDLTEVPVPTKFMFLLLGPVGNQSRYHEIGRSIATLMTDEVFHDVAYHAHNRDDLLAGIDEFLDQVTVLPPGEWDPSIRIEPPKSVPSQEGRKKIVEPQKVLPNGKVAVEEEEESHGDDPALQRTGRLFGGLIQDIKRKAPFYVSDFKDALHVQTLASFMFLYFACLTPIITFGGLLADATKNDLGALESLLAGCIVGVLYALCSGQPLTILGSTGPVLVFETILYNFSEDNGWNYLSFRWWVGLWTGLILIVMVAFDLSALVRYITRFTEESFAALISLIFIKEAVGKLIDITHKVPVNLNPDVSPFHDCICIAPSAPSTSAPTNSTNVTYAVANITTLAPTTTINYSNIEWHKLPRDHCIEHGGSLVGDGCNHVADVFFLSCLLFIGTFAIAYGFKLSRNSRWFPTWVRTIISDFAVILAIALMVGTDAIIGLDTPKLEVPVKFQPTNHATRGWFIYPFHEKNPIWLCVAAVIPALLATILLFMDQQITAVIVNRKENKLKKGCGYHLDLLLVAILIIINSILGLPYFVAATVLSINHVMSLKKESECTAPGERPKFLGVREQRVTGVAIFLMIGLSVFLTSLLKFIPMAVLYGVFLFMGISSLKGMQLVNRIMILFMPMKYQPDYTYLRHVRTRRVHFFTFIQVLCLVMLWVIKTIKAISIAFPIMVLAMCFIRKALDYLFTQTELKWLDDIMPEISKREKDDKELEIQEKQDEYETLLDPKNANPEVNQRPQASIINLAINGGNDSFINQVNITEEVAKCQIWKNLQSNEHQGSTDSSHGGSSSGSSKRDLTHGLPVVLKVKRKHKKRHRKESHGLPTIPHSPTEKDPHKAKKGVAFYIDEEESDKEDTHELIKPPAIFVDPPSDGESRQRKVSV